MPLHDTTFQTAQSFRAHAPTQTDGYFLRNFPERDPYAEPDDIPISSGDAPTSQASSNPGPRNADPRQLALPSQREHAIQPYATQAPHRPQRPGIFSRIGASLKRAWSGLRSLFGRSGRQTQPATSLSPSRGAAFWHTQHPALSGDQTPRTDPYVFGNGFSKFKVKYNEGDQDAGWNTPDLDNYIPKDSPSVPRSFPLFNGAFHIPSVIPGPSKQAGSLAADTDRGDSPTDALYDNVPRTGSFMDQAPEEAKREDSADPLPDRTSVKIDPVPVRTGVEMPGVARHYLDVFEQQERRAKEQERRKNKGLFDENDFD